ncbi:MAG: LysR family transcriptional regulator [Lachnospiraceae bacterium]|nr:LysR family transcriptional regulator [Lachnospiraceae bacterium]
MAKQKTPQRLRNLNFQQIYTFFRVFECENFTKAAADLNLSQAAVSRIIANMENELHLILFIRKVRGVFPTPAAKTLYKGWKEAIRSLENAYEDAYRVQLGYVRSITLGSIYMNQDLSQHVSMMNWFETEYPEITLKVEYDRVENLKEKLITGKCDAIIINDLEADFLKKQGIHYQLLKKEPCSIYVHKTHPLFSKETISLSDFRDQDIVLVGSPEIMHSPAFSDFCREQGLDRNRIHFESDYTNAVILFCRESRIIFSEGLFSEAIYKRCREIPVPGLFSGRGAAWIDDENPVLRRLLQYLKLMESTSCEQ